MHPFLSPLLALHDRIRTDVVSACERAAVDALAGVAHDEEGDTIYAIDKVAEHVLVAEIERTLAREAPVKLVAEGLPGGEVILPHGASPAAVAWTVIVDPIDGTRGLMYQKRPAWILTAVAPGAQATLSDVVVAVQTEIPLVKQHLCDQLWAIRGEGASAIRHNRLTRTSSPIALRPSSSSTLAHGFATIARFFPGVRAELAAIDDALAEALLGPPTPGKAQLFEDQYISTGGQLYELVAGHDRFIADLRAVFERRRDGGPALCCHPYDLCTELIARELGVIVTDEHGHSLDAPLNVSADVSWIGYANASLRTGVEPVLRQLLRARGWLA
jgi:fructose-1,6-bisphosphatase/inositol monophosphatase family enzyme